MSLFDVVVLKDFTLSTRSFLIFALHLLFSFQDTQRKTIKIVLLEEVFFENFLVLFFSEQVSEESFLSPQICLEEWAQVDSNHRPHAYQACALTG